MYASTSARYPPRCVWGVLVSQCVRVCVCGRVHGNLFTRLCVCVRVRQCERARAGDYEWGVFVFQCVSV